MLGASLQSQMFFLLLCNILCDQLTPHGGGGGEQDVLVGSLLSMNPNEQTYANISFYIYILLQRCMIS